MKYVLGLTKEEKIIRRRIKQREYSLKYRTNNPIKKKESALSYYYRNLEKSSAYAKERYKVNREEILEKNSNYIKSNKGKENRSRYYHEASDIEKKKIRARGLINKRVSRGKLLRQPCEICGSNLKITAHHDDYDKPEEVRWLCRQHHANIHRKYGAI